MGALGRDLRGLGGLLGGAFGLHPHELREIALVGRDLALIEMGDDVHRPIEQPAIMADDDGSPRKPREPPFQPHRGFEVEVVGRLIQQQQIGFQEQRAGQRHAHPPAAGIGGQRAGLRGFIEAQPRQDRGGAGGGGIRSDGDQAFMDLGGPMRFRLRVQRRQQGSAFGIGREHGIQQAAIATGSFLRDMAEPRAGGEADLPPIGLEVADDGLEQRGLPRPVPPDQPEPAPGVERHVRPFHQGAAADAEREVADGKDGHAASL
jgi:hypothetical protein